MECDIKKHLKINNIKTTYNKNFKTKLKGNIYNVN